MGIEKIVHTYQVKATANVALEEILRQLTQDKMSNEEAFILLNKAFALSDAKLEQLFRLFDLNCRFLFRASRNEEGLAFCKEYESLLAQFPGHIANWITKERYKLLFHFNLGNKVEALEIGQEIIESVSDYKDKEVEIKLVEILWITGGLATNLGDYDKCMKYFKRALKIATKHELTNSIMSIHAALGDIYKSNKQLDEALVHLNMGIDYSKKMGVSNVHCSMHCNLSKIHMMRQEYDEAYQALQEAMTASKQLNHPRTDVLIKMNLSEYFIETNQLQNFHELTKEIESNDHYQNDEIFQTELLALYSEAYYLEGLFEKALAYANKYENKTIEYQGLLDLQKALELKLKILKAMGAFEKMVVYYDRLFEVKEQIINEANKKHLQEFEVKFQNERKEKEIQALKLESVSFQLQSLRAQMNPHFVFNTIASISQDLKPETVDNSKKLLGSFARLMRANLEFAEQDKISLEDEIRFLTDYLNLEQNRLGEKLSFQINYPKDLEIDFIEIPSMILQPYIENAVKHGIMPLEGNGTIKLSFEEVDELLLCTIEDNGPGREAAKAKQDSQVKHLGKSTSINAKRLDLLAPDIKESLQVQYTDLKDENNKALGTKVVISIKL